MPKGGSVEIDLRLLRSFVQIHESGSLARASDRLACTPAALSMRLKLLETEIGAPLFIRHPGGLDPTARGAELYARALSVLSAYDEMMSATRSRPLRDRVRIGLPDDYATGWLPGLLTRLGPALDRIEVEVTCDLSAHLMAAVQRQEVDLALVTLAARPARARAAAHLPLHWVGEVGTEIRLAAYPEGCVFRRAMIAALEGAGLPWRIAVQSRSPAAIFAAVRAGVAVTCVAEGTAPPGTRATTSRLPSLPDVPIYLVGDPTPRRAVAEAEAALMAAFPALESLPA